MCFSISLTRANLYSLEAQVSRSDVSKGQVFLLFLFSHTHSFVGSSYFTISTFPHNNAVSGYEVQGETHERKYVEKHRKLTIVSVKSTVIHYLIPHQYLLLFTFYISFGEIIQGQETVERGRQFQNSIESLRELTDRSSTLAVRRYNPTWSLRRWS